MQERERENGMSSSKARHVKVRHEVKEYVKFRFMSSHPAHASAPLQLCFTSPHCQSFFSPALVHNHMLSALYMAQRGLRRIHSSDQLECLSIYCSTCC